MRAPHALTIDAHKEPSVTLARFAVSTCAPVVGGGAAMVAREWLAGMARDTRNRAGQCNNVRHSMLTGMGNTYTLP